MMAVLAGVEHDMHANDIGMPADAGQVADGSGGEVVQGWNMYLHGVEESGDSRLPRIATPVRLRRPAREARRHGPWWSAEVSSA